MVAALALLLCTMCAFVVDFGMAYDNKSQAQTAADSAALAAARVYSGKTGTCDALANDGVLQGQVLAEVAKVQEQNLPGSNYVPGDLATCDKTPEAPLGVLHIHYAVSYDSPVGMGSFIIGSDHMTVDNKAVAAVGMTGLTVGSLRPWMICAGQLPPYDQAAHKFVETKVVEVGIPGNGHKPPPSNCIGPNKPGDWWRTACFNGGGSHGDTAMNILQGCENISIVPGQNTACPTADKACLGPYLLGQCLPKGKAGEKVYCLADDSGSVTGFDDEWATLIGKTVAVPVFCAVPDCNPSSVPSASQYNWPVWKIAAVTVCGYAFKKNRSSDTMPTGDCNNYNSDHVKPSDFGDKDSGFDLIFRGLLQTGDTGGFPVETKTSVRLVE